MGIKTVVNLRGERMSGSYWLEVAACKRHGITMENCLVRSRAAPSVEELRNVRDLFERIEFPALMHCKSGADRAGLISTLYMHIVEGQPIEKAVEQLSLKYGHIKQADTGVHPGLVRLSVGIESIDDILADLEAGFAAAGA